MKYMLTHYIDERLELSPADDAAFEVAINAWDTEMLNRGVLVGGARLRPVSEATTLRVRDGEVLVADGPFAETKEQIAGYSVLECADLDEAIEVSSRHPTATIGTFELRRYWAE
ncbi:MAG TPA: YciI family protein [Streptosporangiaceae bacterium]